MWERVIAKLRAGSMPPAGRPRPDAATYQAVATWLESEIDRAWTSDSARGRITAVHRLNRAEYNNTIRDLLGVDIRPADNFPADTAAFGFDKYQRRFAPFSRVDGEVY